MPIKPKHFESWPLERQEEWKVRKRAIEARSRAKNLEKVKAKNARWIADNYEKQKAAVARWAAENRDRRNANEARRRANNPEKVKAIKARNRETMSISYLAGSMRVPTVFLKTLPRELIEAKRQTIRTKRVLKQITQQIDEQTHD